MAGRHRFAQKRQQIAITAVCLGTLAGGLAASGLTLGASSASGSTAAMSGVLEFASAPGGARGGVLNFDTWRGKNVQSITAFTGATTWAGITGITAQGQTNYFAGMNAHVIWSVPLIPADGSDTLEHAASGADNANYVSIAKQLVAGGDGYSTIRLGWEAGGNWFTWGGANDPAAYAAAYRQAVISMRSVSGAHFTFDFNYALRTVDPAAIYPGDAYVDFIGADVYDRSYAVNFPATDHAAVWNEILTEQYGLNYISNFAAQHSKQFTIPEWGVSQYCDGHGGGDDPAFIQNMYNWINSHNVAYADYTNGDDNSCARFALSAGLVSSPIFPQSAALYKQLFGAGSPAATGGSTTTATATTATWVDHSPIRLSYNANRQNDMMLNGQTLGSGPVYVWVDPPTQTAAVKVEFFLDPTTDPLTTTPWVTEVTAPFDLGRTASNGYSSPVYPEQLASGTHILTVLMINSAGTVWESNATFTVG